ncbi:MAG: hypothetical protein R3C56_19410 [Pirellulaceae bacterium]
MRKHEANPRGSGISRVVPAERQPGMLASLQSLAGRNNWKLQRKLRVD